MEKEQITQEQQKAEAADVQESKPQKQRKKEVDKSKYDEYTEYFFIKMSGAKFSDDVLKKIESLKKELMNCSGVSPKRTVRAALGNETLKLVEGIPLPKEYLEIVKASKNPSHYLGK